NAFDDSKSDGTDAFVTKVDATGRRLWFSTYLGGSAGASPMGYSCFGQSVGTGIALDGSDRIYVTGFTSSCEFPTVAPIQCGNASDRSDAFVTVFSPTASELLFSTYLG